MEAQNPESMQRAFEYLDERTGERSRVLRRFYFFPLNRRDDPIRDRYTAFPHIGEREQHLEKANGEIAIVRLATPPQPD